ncbi:MAG: hypothetical protein IT185_07000 [Acidobacteria bacterium]|jgi:hypothetical protein|nr:hypothetical protein [Acidobacteriota bacterium]
MKKPLLGLVLGGVLGIFDGLTAWVSAPELRDQIMGIVIGSTFKGLVAGVLIGWFATRVSSLAATMVAGVLISGFFAYLVAMMPTNGVYYYVEIILPGAVLGLIVGYATQMYGRAAATK